MRDSFGYFLAFCAAILLVALAFIGYWRTHHDPTYMPPGEDDEHDEDDL